MLHFIHSLFINFFRRSSAALWLNTIKEIRIETWCNQNEKKWKHDATKFMPILRVLLRLGLVSSATILIHIIENQFLPSDICSQVVPMSHSIVANSLFCLFIIFLTTEPRHLYSKAILVLQIILIFLHIPFSTAETLFRLIPCYSAVAKCYQLKENQKMSNTSPDKTSRGPDAICLSPRGLGYFKWPF